AEVPRRLIRDGAAVIEPLIETGKVLEWGVAMPMLEGSATPFTHVEWMTLANWDAAVAIAESLLLTREGSPAWQDLATRLEVDVITRSEFAGAGRPDRPQYIFLTFLRAKAGTADAGTQALRSVMAAALDPLIPVKHIMNYGALVPAMSADIGWTLLAWYATRTLLDRNWVDRGITDLPAALKDSQWVSRAATDPAVEAGSREDQVLRILYYRRRSNSAP
ncbi:MAG: hypothetical protein ACKOEC_16830, partial [Acidimicrobiia bacterium]